jgi:hypothetical protein
MTLEEVLAQLRDGETMALALVDGTVLLSVHSGTTGINKLVDSAEEVAGAFSSAVAELRRIQVAGS